MLCILSSAWASCSLSTGVDPERDAKELRRELIPRWSKEDGPVEAPGDSWEAIALSSWDKTLCLMRQSLLGSILESYIPEKRSRFGGFSSCDPVHCRA